MSEDVNDPVQTLEGPEALERLLALPLALIYKHSPACWQSYRAMGHVRRFSAETGAPPAWIIDVIRQRPLARLVADRLGIRHESPQVIVVRHGIVAWHGSHGTVKYRAIRDAITDLRQSA